MLNNVGKNNRHSCSLDTYHALSTVAELYLHCLYHFHNTTVLLPTSQMRKLMLEEVEELASGHAITKVRVRIQGQAVSFQRPLFGQISFAFCYPPPQSFWPSKGCSDDSANGWLVPTLTRSKRYCWCFSRSPHSSLVLLPCP